MSLDIETRAMMLESADRLLTDLCTSDLINRSEKGEFPVALWQSIEDAGLTLVAVPEAHGGVGGSLADFSAVLRLLGSHAAPVPAAESALARYLGALAELELPAGALTVAISETPLQLSADGKRVSGDVRLVPWAGQVSGTIGLARTTGGATTIVLLPKLQGEAGANNAAGEPRGRLKPAELPVAMAGRIDLTPSDVLALAALMRVQQMAGASQQVLDICLVYARERKQFGRAIGNFQAVQQMLAELAGQVAAVQSAAESAADAAAHGDFGFPLAAAKVRASENAGRIAAMAHQVLGAMGFTYEHRLHHFTRRLWSWRDEFGSDTAWAQEIGRAVTGAGAEALWPRLTGYEQA